MSLAPVAGLVSFAGMASKRSCEFDADTDASRAAFLGQPAPPPANCDKHDGALYGGLVGAAVLLGGGVTMLLVGVEKVPVERTGEVSIRPWLSPSTAGLGLSTSF